jgi:hypothetical protein
VLTDPSGLSPQPDRSPAGEAGSTNTWWYDASTSVQLTAQTVTGYTFSYWDVDTVSQGTNPINVGMSAIHTATAHYASSGPPPSVVPEVPFGTIAAVIAIFGATGLYISTKMKKWRLNIRCRLT